MTDCEPIGSIHVAIHRGRGRRGWKDPAHWTRLRAQLLTFLALGEPLVWLERVRVLAPAASRAS
jgi:hypothetical protein